MDNKTIDSAEISEVEVLNSDGEVIEKEDEIVFKKPHTFEGNVYKNLDLSGLENLTSKDLIDTQRLIDKSGSSSFLPEMTVEYALILTSKATKKPIEFLYSLHPREALRIKNKVIGFLYGRD